jgi:hypothetical protein
MNNIKEYLETEIVKELLSKKIEQISSRLELIKSVIEKEDYINTYRKAISNLLNGNINEQKISEGLWFYESSEESINQYALYKYLGLEYSEELDNKKIDRDVIIPFMVEFEGKIFLPRTSARMIAFKYKENFIQNNSLDKTELDDMFVVITVIYRELLKTLNNWILNPKLYIGSKTIIKSEAFKGFNLKRGYSDNIFPLLYISLCKEGIINEQKTDKKKFIGILTNKTTEGYIYIESTTAFVIIYDLVLNKIFNRLTESAIEQSGMFITPRGVNLNTNNIYKQRNRIKEEDSVTKERITKLFDEEIAKYIK